MVQRLPDNTQRCDGLQCCNQPAQQRSRNGNHRAHIQGTMSRCALTLALARLCYDTSLHNTVHTNSGQRVIRNHSLSTAHVAPICCEARMHQKGRTVINGPRDHRQHAIHLTGRSPRSQNRDMARTMAHGMPSKHFFVSQCLILACVEAPREPSTIVSVIRRNAN